MKALSVKEPWAALLLGPKDVENRDRAWKFRGRLAIHASKRLDLAEYKAAEDLIRSRHILGVEIDPAQCPLGAIIGTVEIFGSVTHSDSLWFVGPYGLLRRKPIALPKPIPCRGQLGLWDVPPDVERAIEKQLQEARW